MQLQTLVASLPGLTSVGGKTANPVITGLTTDPNLCRNGYLYVAAESETVDSTRYGVRLDGRDYIDIALRNGAVAVLTTPGITLADEFGNATLLTHAQPLNILGALASRFFGEPRPKVVALVTGTNGKTSTVNFCRMLWTASGRQSCSVGNLGGVCSDGSVVWDRDPTLSVPETVFLHRMLHDLALSGVQHVAMEATSHAFFDYRLHGVCASIGAFTNLTRDHLDFHGTMDEYFRVKMKLFDEVLEPESFAVLNADATMFSPALDHCRARKHQVLSYGRAGSDITLVGARRTGRSQILDLNIFGKPMQTQLNLLGEFQVSNALCSLAICIASGVDPDEAVSLLPELTEVEGRLNLVGVSDYGGNVIVDYAHTPDGLKAALDACRSFTAGRVLIVFGADGDRDVGKREEMGAVATQLADEVIVTDACPNSEDRAQIRRAVLSGAPGAKEFADRADAIEYGISALRNGDTLLLAGMGHEKFQTIGDALIPFNDTEVALRILSSANNRRKAHR
jgi:UDP-N-acetylmuramoyl-L-alanyl-D-glutamate--2,6-diaminopimelate ligase